MSDEWSFNKMTTRASWDTFILPCKEISGGRPSVYSPLLSNLISVYTRSPTAAAATNARFFREDHDIVY